MRNMFTAALVSEINTGSVPACLHLSTAGERMNAKYMVSITVEQSTYFCYFAL